MGMNMTASVGGCSELLNLLHWCPRSLTMADMPPTHPTHAHNHALQLNMDNALMRHEFLEALLRVAVVKVRGCVWFS